MPTLNNKTLLSPFETSSGTILELPKHLLYAPSLMTTKYPESSTALLAITRAATTRSLSRVLTYTRTLTSTRHIVYAALATSLTSS
jgi:hypothetical protein